MMTTVQQMSSFEFQMVCAVRLILASCCGLCIGIEPRESVSFSRMRLTR